MPQVEHIHVHIQQYRPEVHLISGQNAQYHRFGITFQFRNSYPVRWIIFYINTITDSSDIQSRKTSFIDTSYTLRTINKFDAVLHREFNLVFTFIFLTIRWNVQDIKEEQAFAIFR